MSSRALSSQLGMQMGWMVGTNLQGVRGALATHSYKPGDIITVVPRNITFDLGPQEWTAPVSPKPTAHLQFHTGTGIGFIHSCIAWTLIQTVDVQSALR